MGFFDKLKAAKNAMTGGGAKVFLECGSISYDGPFKAVVKVQVKDAPLKIDRAYLKVRGEEQVEVPDTDVVFDAEDGQQRRTETVYAKNETIDLDLTVAEGQELEANQSYEWEVEIALPANAPKVYRGRYCKHIYSAFAGLDCFGNDPDSGWVEIKD